MSGMRIRGKDARYMDLSLKPCTTTQWDVPNHSSSILADRLSSLPDEMLIRILSLVPTKDAAAVCILSRRLRLVFPWITSLDLDDLPISHCVKNPNGMERFPTFLTFVDRVLQAYQSEYLTRFRLGVGPDFITRYFRSCKACDGGCETECLPDLKSTQINAWISIPITRCGLRELDLRIHVREQGDAQLPPEIFTCETLEVLKLDVNLGVDRASSVSSFCLPNLKLLHLFASLIAEDGFVTRLVSSCPLLEDLTVNAWWNHVHVTSISSPSLRRLCLRMNKIYTSDNTDFVHIDTPNLEYLEYYDNLALRYSITNMPRLVKADIDILFQLMNEASEVSYQQMLNLIKPLSNVQHLNLNGSCTEELNLVGVKDQLPVFPNLKYLELGFNGYGFWDNTLLAFLSHSPALETLVFPQGIIIGDDYNEVHGRYRVPLDMERKFCRTTLAIIPWCCRFHLKKIVIANCFGKQREVEWIQFLLRHSLVLEEFVICRSKYDYCYQIADQMALESALRNLPRATVNCSIQVQ